MPPHLAIKETMLYIFYLVPLAFRHFIYFIHPSMQNKPLTKCFWGLFSPSVKLKSIICILYPNANSFCLFQVHISILIDKKNKQYQLILNDKTRKQKSTLLYRRSNRPRLSRSKMISCTIERTFCLVRSTVRSAFLGAS